MIIELIKELFALDHTTENQYNKFNENLLAQYNDQIKTIRDHLLKYGLIIASSSSKVIVTDSNADLLKALKFDHTILRVISPRKFEELICYVYELAGYKTKLTKQTRDGGVDILVWFHRLY